VCISNKELAHIWWDGIWTCLSDDWAVVWCLHYATRVRDYSWYIYIGFVKVGIVDSLFSSELMFGISHSDSCMQVLWEANCMLFYTGNWSMRSGQCSSSSCLGPLYLEILLHFWHRDAVMFRINRIRWLFMTIVAHCCDTNWRHECTKLCLHSAAMASSKFA
jgi:hypothetical protein